MTNEIITYMRGVRIYKLYTMKVYVSDLCYILIAQRFKCEMWFISFQQLRVSNLHQFANNHHFTAGWKYDVIFKVSFSIF
jgi:hypothetical protein